MLVVPRAHDSPAHHRFAARPTDNSAAGTHAQCTFCRTPSTGHSRSLPPGSCAGANKARQPAHAQACVPPQRLLSSSQNSDWSILPSLFLSAWRISSSTLASAPRCARRSAASMTPSSAVTRHAHVDQPHAADNSSATPPRGPAAGAAPGAEASCAAGRPRGSSAPARGHDSIDAALWPRLQAPS